jgi:Outer membrane protein beta-barrel domain
LYSETIKIKYLPFNTKIKSKIFGQKVQFFVNAGPYFGYLIKQTFVRTGDNIPTTTSNNTSLNNWFDTGISTGLGLSVPIKTKFAFSFEVRNNLGLYNVSDVPAINNGTIKTNSINFLFGFTYKLGQRTLETK